MTAADAFSEKKRYRRVGNARVAYYEEGEGETVLFLHGCPFSSYIWRNVIPRLSSHYRCVAPDLLGLGDTETPREADWALRAQASMAVGLLDTLGIGRAHVVGHDHGGATAQLLATEHPHRIDRLVLSNAEAYDNWPSTEERPFVRLTQVPVLGDAVMWRFDRPTLLLWGAEDVHFGLEWAERLLRDIPGAVRLDALSGAGHLVMEERPDRFAAWIGDFLSEPTPGRKHP